MVENYNEKNINDSKDNVMNYNFEILRDWLDDDLHYYDLKINENNNMHYVCVHINEENDEDLESYLEENIQTLISLPKTTELSNLTYDIFDIVSASDSDMCFIEDLRELEEMGYTTYDLEDLLNDIKKYNLENVITINEDNFLIIGYGDLQCAFNDDRFYENNLNNDEINEKNNDL